MRRIFIAVLFCFFGISLSAQSISFFRDEYTRQDASFEERFEVLELVRDSGLSDLGEFYHEALRLLLLRIPSIRTNSERNFAERSAVIICEGLANERYAAAAPEIWNTAVAFDAIHDTTIDGNAMRAALIALGQIDAREFIPQIVLRLDHYNSQTFRNPETRRRVQMAVTGCINALETFQDISGFRPVFFVSIGSYDPPIREMAYNALPNIAEDPADVIITIIQSSSTDPSVKLEAWNSMLRSRAPDSSKARVAAAALATGWTFSTGNRQFQVLLRELRKSAINAIRQFGVADDSVYQHLERSYSSNYHSNTPDYDEIAATLNALAAIRSEEAVTLLHRFLRDLHSRRRTGPWGAKERQLFEWVISCLGVTGTSSQDVLLILRTIERTEAYTPQERRWATEALRQLGQS